MVASACSRGAEIIAGHYPASDVNVFFNLYDNLVLSDEQLNLTPGLATSWQLVDDKT